MRNIISSIFSRAIPGNKASSSSHIPTILSPAINPATFNHSYLIPASIGQGHTCPITYDCPPTSPPQFLSPMMNSPSSISTTSAPSHSTEKQNYILKVYSRRSITTNSTTTYSRFAKKQNRSKLPSKTPSSPIIKDLEISG